MLEVVVMHASRVDLYKLSTVTLGDSTSEEMVVKKACSAVERTAGPAYGVEEASEAERAFRKLGPEWRISLASFADLRRWDSMLLMLK